ncbi:hypothetical protein MKZ38_008367 [Zalerion maritima]|uniref:Uncharacterized protein n=1 Tax=Zalerion maritima TaxID=339359 RepID=A0AAD5WW63_9PEZI|nr:hypothetical protein MKZ38_008367 [Zalerion maritima]
MPLTSSEDRGSGPSSRLLDDLTKFGDKRAEEGSLCHKGPWNHVSSDKATDAGRNNLVLLSPHLPSSPNHRLLPPGPKYPHKIELDSDDDLPDSQSSGFAASSRYKALKIDVETDDEARPDHGKQPAGLQRNILTIAVDNKVYKALRVAAASDDRGKPVIADDLWYPKFDLDGFVDPETKESCQECLYNEELHHQCLVTDTVFASTSQDGSESTKLFPCSPAPIQP